MKYSQAAKALLVVAALCCAAFAIADVKTTDSITLQVREVGKQLKCQCGCAYTIADCNMLYCHFREPVNQDIREGLEAGLSVDGVYSKIVAKYGDVLRSEPKVEGFGAVGWVMPFAALAVGFVIAPFVVQHWRKRGREKAADTADRPVDPAAVQRFEQEIERDLEREE